MDKIDVIWVSYHDDILARGYWDQGLLEDTLKHFDVTHHDGLGAWANNTVDRRKLNWLGAIVVINGRTHTTDEDIQKLNSDIANLAWVLFIDTGDEEAVFPWREVKHPLMRVWMMLPRMNEHNDTHFKLPNGYRPTTHKELIEGGYTAIRALDFSFVGQVNHDRREQCVVAAQSIENDYKCEIVTTDKFGDEAGGLNYKKYMDVMAVSKIVLCPSGIESPDNFRLYEALEAGCLPIVDAFSSKHKAPGFWRYLFGNDIPFPIVEYWDELPKVLPELLRDYPANANRAFAWWQQKKREIKYRLLDDVRELSK